jgi:hypothetical protein
MDVVEHTVGSTVVADELPDVLLRIEHGAIRWQQYDGDVLGHHELAREMPSGLIGQEQRTTAWGDIGGEGLTVDRRPGNLAKKCALTP